MTDSFNLILSNYIKFSHLILCLSLVSTIPAARFLTTAFAQLLFVLSPSFIPMVCKYDILNQHCDLYSDSMFCIVMVTCQ